MRIALAVFLLIHGLIHLPGFAKGLGLAAVPGLQLPVGRVAGVLWLLAAVGFVAAAALVLAKVDGWWMVGAPALVLSQALVLGAWGDARFGTVANLVALAAVAYAFAAQGPLSLPAEYRAARALASLAPATVLTEADLAPLPEPVQRYLRRAGAVGQPRVQSVTATWRGRIRAEGGAWMPFTATQLNTYHPERRFFLMDATMKGLPVDVLHGFDEQGARMRVRLLSAFSMVDESGPILTRTETVTLFNDLCVLAPSELVGPDVAWEAVDAHTARARYTLRGVTISAELRFDDEGDLVDFSSADRSPDPASAATQAWTTPLRDRVGFAGRRVPTRAETIWHPATGAWTYGEFELTGYQVNLAGGTP